LPAIFITATGTEIGKTFVAAGLLARLRERGRKVAAVKPVVSGFDENHFDSSDPAILLEAAGRTTDIDTIGRIAPWRFAAPLSPDMAAQQEARQEGRTIDFAEVVRFCRASIDAAEDVLVIEGIGGLLVPLNEGSTVADLIQVLDVPLVLVAGTYLGTLSHTLSALEVARTRELSITAVVLNQTPNSPVPIDATCASLKNFCGNVPIVVLTRDGSGNAAAFDQLAQCVEPQ
jgi:dethiobiotin synthetase